MPGRWWLARVKLPCKPLWPDTSSPDPGAETCVSASDTCPGKACGPWQHQKQKTEVGTENQRKGGWREGKKRKWEKPKEKKNHTSRKNRERKMQRTIKEVFQINKKEEKKMGEVIKKYYFTAYEQGEREKREKSDSLLTLSSSSGRMWTEWGGGGASHSERSGAILWFGVI